MLKIYFVAGFLCWWLSLNGCVQSFGATDKKTWTYYFISTEYTTSDKNLMNIELKVDRVSRGVFGITGILNVNYDIDNSTEVAATVHRSSTGSSDYVKLPFSIERQHLYKFLNSFYKNVIMSSIKDCSNLPQFENEFVPPFEKKIYTLDKCQVSNDALPQHMQEGYYKVEILGFGPVDYLMQFMIKVETAY